LEFYAGIFEAQGALDRLEAFASHHGADFYGLPRSTQKVALRREPQVVPKCYRFGGDEVVPLLGGETIDWTFQGIVSSPA
jgi:dihydroorotase